jgi:putative FmdB family regulatory protein
MASYDLVCEECGHDFEVFMQGFLKDDAKVCPECGSREVRQLITGFLVSSSSRSSGGSSSFGGSASGGCGHSSGFG